MKTFTFMLAVTALLFAAAWLYLSPLIDAGVARVNASAFEVRP